MTMRFQFVLLAFITVALAGCSPKTDASKADAKKSDSKPSHGTMPPVATKPGVNYVTEIKPLFDKSCVDCHGPKKHKGGLQLDSLEAAVHGGDDGPVFQVGKSEFSLIVSNIARLGVEDDWMPPVDDKHPTLTAEEVGLVRAWIDQGAK